MKCKLFTQEISPGIYRISDALHGPNDDGYSDSPGNATANSYLIVGGEKAALIDLALDTPDLYAYAQSLAGKPVILLLTHGHCDHVFHLGTAPEAWLHAADIPLITEGISGVYGPQSPIPFHVIVDGQTIDLGGRTLEAISLPGHTLGSMLFLDRKSGILFTGDTCARRLLYGITPTVSLETHCEYLKKLLKLDFSLMYTAHDRCPLLKTHIQTVLNCIHEQLPKAQETVEIPGVGSMRNLRWGREDTLQFFDMAVTEEYLRPNLSLQATHLRTLHRENPVGIDETPCFSWYPVSNEQNTHQSAWQIMVFSNGELCWDSGFVVSDQQTFVQYHGKNLKSRTQYTWKLTVWDNHGHIAANEARFETALLLREDWHAHWIEAPFERAETPFQSFWHVKPPVWFEKQFIAPQKVQSARLYATAHGVYQAYVNGVRPDDREFAPEHTVYEKILYYQTYDATNLIHEGENSLSFQVADGWYLCPQTRQQISGFTGLPAVLFQLEITFADGTGITVFSDGSENCHIGKLVWSDLFLGEKKDDTLPAGKTQRAALGAFPMNNLCAQPMDPVRPIMTLPAKEIYRSPKGEWIVDFGQIICGRARIWIEAEAGDEIVFEYFEIPDQAGNYRNTMIAPQKDIYISDGTPHLYEAAFTFHGFRYMRVSGIKAPVIQNFTAVVLSSEKENLSSFRCSDERLNRLYQNIRWSQRNNTLSVPTDCPTREKAGFTGDIQIYAPTALLNEEMTPFLTSWLRNLSAAQAENGSVPITIPETAPYRRLMEKNAQEFGDQYPVGVAGWSDAAVLVPYAMYRATGNTLILERQWESITRWCDYIVKTANGRRENPELPEDVDRWLWNTGFHFGEWLIPSEKKAMTHREACEGSAFYTAPIFGCVSLLTAAKIADILDKPEKAVYQDAAIRMKNAIQKALIKQGRLFTDHMGAYVLMLHFGLVPDEDKNRFESQLVSLLEQNGNRLDTGFLATPYLLPALTEMGRKDLAASLLFQTKMPSWLYEVEQGATAIWESWDAVQPGEEPAVTSYDHYAFGCADAWVFEQVAGIRMIKPGFKEITVCPEPGLFPLTECERTFMSEYGEIAVHWDQNTLNLTIPCGVTAQVVWKGINRTVGSGTYTFGRGENEQ